MNNTFWNIERDGITQSMVNTFLACPMKANLGYREGYTTDIRNKSAIDFGLVVHQNLDHTYTAFRERTPDYSWLDMLNAENDKHQRKLFEAGASAPTLENLYEVYSKASPVLGGYYSFWNERDFQGGVTWIDLEREFKVPYELVLDKHDCNGDYNEFVTIPLCGKIDGIYTDAQGDWWLFETKTKGRIDDDAIVERLTFDVQVVMYMYVIEQLYGKRPKGVCYNLIRSPQLRQSTVPGKESAEEFYERIGADIRLRPTWYYLRHYVYMDDNDVTKGRYDLNQIIHQMYLWSNGDFNYRNSASCFTGWSPCQYMRVCSCGDMDGFTKRERPFMELSV